MPALLAFAVLYVALAPAVVNGDGLGYLRAAIGGGAYPGHLLYLPILRLLPGARPIDLLWPARALSVASSISALILFADTARRMRLPAWLPAAVGLGCCYSVLVSASDVETYAPALLCICAAINFAVRGWRPAAALAAALATLIHIENLLLVAPLWFLIRRWALLPLVLVAAAYAAAGMTPLGATHGFHYPLHLWTPLVAVYGAAKALIYSPYHYEASWARVLGCFALGAAALLALLRLAWSGGAPLGRPATLAWLGTYGGLGAVFYPSDHERWIFLLPLLWLSVAAANRPRPTLITALFLLGANLALWGPRARDDSWRRRAEAATRHLQSGDLVVSPGHGWDEYVGFWGGPEVRRFPLVYFAAELGSRPALAERLAREEATATRVVFLRMGDDGDPMGWKELAAFGITPTTLDNLIPAQIEAAGDGVYLATRSRN